MPLSKPPFLADEELGKKDDDHRLRTSLDQQWQSKSWKPPRRRRMLLLPVVIYLVYLFFKNMPTDLGPVSRRAKSSLPPSQHIMPDGPSQSVPPPRDEFDSKNESGLYYEGEIKFYELGKTLKLFPAPADQGGKVASSATVFAAASLESVSDLLPLACRMATQKLNAVHFLLMGRDDISIEGIQRVNSLDRANCPVHWHDARADYAQWSTDARMEQAVAAVLPYIQAYLRPQLIITQGESWEDTFFLRGIRKSRDLGIPHIALPHAARDLMWIAALDSKALQTWNDIHVEILIYASPNSAGSLMRLIRSLEHADFLGLSSSLTIELPSRVDSELLRFLKEMTWPPDTTSKLTIRRRLQLHEMSPSEASLHAVEAFYPKDPTMSHVLLLSPDMELVPSFYHYLMYTILKYRHSTRSDTLPSNLMGISLEPPSFHLTTESTKRPDIDRTQFSNRNTPDTLPLFLSQAPNSNAALYFGDKWAELHAFLARRLTTEAGAVTLQAEKIISKRYPAFMEFLLELIRARGYYLLYPAFSDRRFSLANFHDELFQTPEEFSEDNSEPPPSEALTKPTSLQNPLSGDATLMSLLDTFSLELPDISHLPVLSYRGEEMSETVFSQGTEEYVKDFRVRYGGCSENSLHDEMGAELFCAK